MEQTIFGFVITYLEPSPRPQTMLAISCYGSMGINSRYDGVGVALGVYVVVVLFVRCEVA